jgi:hypothetical protein
MEEAVNVAKLVHEHLIGFHKHYKLPRYFDDEDFLIWCRSNLGREYRDWQFHKGHKKDPYTVVHIKDPKWCTIFELTWSHLIQGQLDIK